MRIVMFYHSLISDWNHGNAHFLRGVVTALRARGHEVEVFEPADGWSLTNLVAERGAEAIAAFQRAFPRLRSHPYVLAELDLDRALDGADLVLVHEWNDRELVAAIGRHRALVGGYRLLFHDTHHRSVTDREGMARYDLSRYDGVLAFGEVIRRRYLDEGWAERAWTWHEAADVRLFRPLAGRVSADGGTSRAVRDRTSRAGDDGTGRAAGDGGREGDLVWIGNWGDDERTTELQEFLIGPAEALRLRARVYGVRYPAHALTRLARASIEYGGWLPNYEVPRVFARYAVTVHVPRRPYVAALPGIPTIRVFEALACGIPLVCAPWDDAERLFSPGEDFLMARDGAEMQRLLRDLLADPDAARRMAEHGRRTILERHTCAHRVDELLTIAAELDTPSAVADAGTVHAVRKDH